ncbi:MAG: MBL fold metallo-hydrolase [Ruminococcaceae bacterium]|nr:MBL fold metallo-hydrolase [Oscillospiraceae bacterium]
MSDAIRIVSLFSGSKGNCTYCSFDGYEFLIDAGGSAKKICDSLSAIGVSVGSISDIFITHEHTDHVSSLPVLLKRTDAVVHMNSLSAKYAARKYPALSGRICEHPLIYEHVHGDVCVRSFPLSHDSVSCVGYVVLHKGEKIFATATDTGYISSDTLGLLCGCRYVSCEANHDVDMLLFGIYPPYLKERILSSRGHLSNKDCASLVHSLLDSGCERILLSHLSEENNTPDIARREVVRECGEYVSEKIYVASQRCSTVLI